MAHSDLLIAATGEDGGYGVHNTLITANVKNVLFSITPRPALIYVSIFIFYCCIQRLKMGREGRV